MDRRETLIRENFALYREIGYQTFHAQFFTDGEAMRKWPDPAVREQQLRSQWDTLAEQHFAGYRQRMMHTSTEQLSAQRDLLKGVLANPPEVEQYPGSDRDTAFRDLHSGITAPRSLLDRVHAAAAPDGHSCQDYDRVQARGH